MAVDDTTVARATTATNGLSSVTTASFTPPNNSLLVACIQSDGNDGAGTADPVFSCSGGGLTWTKRVERIPSDSGAQEGGAAIYTAIGAGASMTVTVGNGGAGFGPISVKVYIVPAADFDSATPVGANGEGSSTTNNITPTIFTNQVAGSYAFVSGDDWAAQGAPTSSDLTEDSWTMANEVSGTSGYKTLGATGSQTANLDGGGTSATAWNWCAIEVRAAAGGPFPPFPWQRIRLRS